MCDAYIPRQVEEPCHRIKQQVVTALSHVPGVRHIASFGSIAEGCSDRWSDIDLLVACDNAACSPWSAAAAIRAAKPVCFYRMFTGVPQPSGRYWFADEAPFHRIDINFYCVADYLALCRDGSKNGHPITTRGEYSASAAPDPIPDHLTTDPVAAVIIQPHETEAGRCLYQHLEAVKEQMRGRGQRDSRATRAALVRMLAQSRAVTFGGGDFIGLARKCLDL